MSTETPKQAEPLTPAQIREHIARLYWAIPPDAPSARRELRAFEEALMASHARQAEALATAQQERDHAETAIKTVIYTVGGTVEGNPTARHNYLQRLRALLEIEADHARLAQSLATVERERDEARRTLTDIAKDINRAYGSMAIDLQDVPALITRLRGEAAEVARLREALAAVPVSHRPQPINTDDADRAQPIAGALRRDIARLLDNLYGLHARPGHVDAVLEVFQVHSPVKVPVSPQGADGWQPIETAPKDGTQVLLAWAGEVRLARFVSVDGPPHPFANWLPLDRGAIVITRKPTHWRPLPPPPAPPSTPTCADCGGCGRTAFMQTTCKRCSGTGQQAMADTPREEHG